MGAECRPSRTLFVPPSHQIRISPEKSEFDAKGVVGWCLMVSVLWSGYRFEVVAGCSALAV